MAHNKMCMKEKNIIQSFFKFNKTCLQQISRLWDKDSRTERYHVQRPRPLLVNSHCKVVCPSQPPWRWLCALDCVRLTVNSLVDCSLPIYLGMMDPFDAVVFFSSSRWQSSFFPAAMEKYT
jgi:hypothetical protein